MPVINLDNLPAPASKAQNGTIDINQLPPTLRNRLRVLDSDGDGVIDANELLQEVASHQEAEQTVHLLKRITGMLLVTMVIVIAVVAGLTFAIVDGSRNTDTGADVLRNRDTGAALAVKEVETDVPLSALAYMPKGAVHVDRLDLTDYSTGAVYTKHVHTLAIERDNGTVVTTLELVGGGNVVLYGLVGFATLPNKAPFAVCGDCAKCGLRSVASEEVLSGLDQFKAGVGNQTCATAFDDMAAAEGGARRRRFVDLSGLLTDPEWMGTMMYTCLCETAGGVYVADQTSGSFDSILNKQVVTGCYVKDAARNPDKPNVMYAVNPIRATTSNLSPFDFRLDKTRRGYWIIRAFFKYYQNGAQVRNKNVVFAINLAEGASKPPASGWRGVVTDDNKFQDVPGVSKMSRSGSFSDYITVYEGSQRFNYDIYLTSEELPLVVFDYTG